MMNQIDHTTDNVVKSRAGNPVFQLFFIWHLIKMFAEEQAAKPPNRI